MSFFFFLQRVLGTHVVPVVPLLSRRYIGTIPPSVPHQAVKTSRRRTKGKDTVRYCTLRHAEASRIRINPGGESAGAVGWRRTHYSSTNASTWCKTRPSEAAPFTVHRRYPRSPFQSRLDPRIMIYWSVLPYRSTLAVSVFGEAHSDPVRFNLLFSRSALLLVPDVTLGKQLRSYFRFAYEYPDTWYL